ncbi:transcriptional repressor [Methylomonas paludis]|uniref:Transcriptional repressor n=1 Tax=Methylomonas paludis TaxID=1173101 RepID=A0A975MQM6_9GAMM|nr:transcriptional repressor [Methylomonas paludis]QWF72130.1 transcriptional repressor [Methylomonas paludis]
MNQTSPTEHDHNQCIHNAISAAEHLCRQRGVQLTPIRHKVLELILTSHKAVKAYDLLDQIKPVNDAAKPATVYRALDFLLEQGLIHRVESLNAFVGCHRSGTQHDQLLLICSVCHDIEERPATQVIQALAAELSTARFTAQRKTIEIHGLCEKCQTFN